jgi:hypothetical protein
LNQAVRTSSNQVKQLSDGMANAMNSPALDDYSRPSMGKSREFALGYVLGQAETYIEQINAGAKLAAQLGCSDEHVAEVVAAAATAGCETIVQEREFGRSAVWIFRHDYVRRVIESFAEKTTPPTASEVWAMGKLFSYSDVAIANYIREHNIS